MDSQVQIDPIGYLSLELRKDTGAHYTPLILANFVAAEISNQIDQTINRKIRILDPATGDGELLLALLRKLSSLNNSSDLEVFGFDTDSNAIRTASKRIKSEFPNIPVLFYNEDFLEYAIRYGRNDLFTPEIEKFDIVIANPPYVRTQVLGAKGAKRIANLFNLSGRVDLYHAFLLGIAMILKPNGVTGIITSNRFMTTKSGASVRSAIINEYKILHLWDLGDTQLFEAAVLPSVLLLERKNGIEKYHIPGFTSIYTTSAKEIYREVTNVIDALNYPGIVKTETGQTYDVKVGVLDHGQMADGIWRISTLNLEKSLSRVKANSFCTFGNLGKIRVGIKTTADKVFIRSDWNTIPADERPELLFPLITHHSARRYRMIGASKPLFILYPHTVIDGKRTTVDISKYPKTEKYLNENKSILEARDYLISSGRKWFEIWVPQNPDFWIKPKLIFRDISEKPTFWIDLDGGIVNGDCYWLVCEKPGGDELLWLALAIGNSTFIEWFYDNSFNNKLYSGRRRFMTQYVEKFPLPNPNTDICKKIINLTKKAYEMVESNELTAITDELDRLIWKAFGLSVEEIFR